MEESGRIEKKPETNKRKLMIVFALIGVLVLASAGTLVYFYQTSSSVKEDNLVESKVKSDGNPEIVNIEAEDSSIESKNFYFFDSVNEKTVVRLNDDDGSFSERFTLDIKGNNAQISQTSEQICGAVVGEDNFQVYKVDLKTKETQNILKVPFKEDEVGEPKFRFSPDCKSFAYYFEKNCEENGFKEKSKVILRDLKTGSENEIDWITRKFPSGNDGEEIFVRNGGRVIRKTKKPGKDKVAEVSLFSKETDYEGKSLFIFHYDFKSYKNAFQVSHDASRILYVEIRQNPTNKYLKDRYSIIYDVSSEMATDFGAIELKSLMSMNGGKIAFYEWKLVSNKTKVKVIDVDTKKIENEFESEGCHELHSWSNNGKFLLFLDYGELYKLSLSDKNFEPVKDTDGKILSVRKEL